MQAIPIPRLLVSFAFGFGLALHAAESPDEIFLFARTAPLRAAVTSGNAPRIEEILTANPQFLESRDLEGSSLLHIAAFHGQLDSARALLQKGARIDATNRAGNTPLHSAALGGSQKAVEWLVENGAHAGALNAQGKLPLELADENGHRAAARFLRLNLENAAAKIRDSRISIAVLPFINEAPLPDQAHWAISSAASISSAFGRFAATRTLDRGAVQQAMRTRNAPTNSLPTAALAREIGEQLEARRVVWGSFRFAPHQFSLSLHLLNVATGQPLLETQVAASSFHEASLAAVEKLAVALQIHPSPEEWARARRPKTKSGEALEALSRAFAAYESDQPLANTLAHAERSIALDPDCIDCHLALAMASFTQGDIEQVQKIIRQIPESAPKTPDYHLVVGATFMMRRNPEEALTQYKEALRLQPNFEDALDRIGEVHGMLEHPEACLYFLNRSKWADPSNGNVRASLARAYATTRDREAALRELGEAFRLDPSNANTLQLAPAIYEMLGETALAVEHYEKFLRLAETLGASADLRAWARRGAERRSTLVATPVSALPPKPYTAENLKNELQSRLTPDELSRLVNPLADTPAMKLWAHELTRNTPSDEARARVIFQELTRRIQIQQTWGSRSAIEVFEAWKRPDEDFNCNELAKLYVALAREAGLRACYAHVEQDASGRGVYHDCAVVFLANDCYLVDPAYRWFGVPHRKFRVLDDLQTIAHSVAHAPVQVPGKPGSTRDLSILLDPDSAWTRIQHARALLPVGAFARARAALDEAARLEPGRWDEHIVRGMLAALEDKLQDALTHLEAGLKLNPDDGLGHVWNAQVFEKLGRPREARDQYRLALGCLLNPSDRSRATRDLILLNEQLGEN